MSIGNINTNGLDNYFDLNDDVRIITWITDPLKWIILNYNFNPYDLNVISRVTKSNTEFARMEVKQNLMSKILGRTRNNTTYIDQKIIDEISSFNSLDVELYNRALELIKRVFTNQVKVHHS